MADEMAVQGNRQSPLPYVIGGTAVGGTAGYLAANKLPFKKPMYSSYEDILKEVQDTTDFEALKKDKAEDVVKALDAAKIENEKLSNLGKLSFEEITSADLSKFDVENKARVEYEAAVKALKETTPDDKLIEKVAKELNKGATEITEEMKNAAKEVIESDKTKYFKEETKAVEEKLEALVKEAGNIQIFDDAVGSKYNAIKEARESSKKTLEPFLEKCKTGNKLLWAGICAATLAIAGLMFAQKSKD